MNQYFSKEKSSFRRIIETALRLWIKRKCKRIKSLNVNIVCTAKELIKGFISSVNLHGESILFQGIEIESCELKANSLKFKLEPIKRRFTLKENFIINGELILSSSSLKQTLLADKWNWVNSSIV